MLRRLSFLVLGGAVLLGLEYRRRFAFPTRTPEELRKSGYDYIVVGAGSAGAALAARLSEDASKTVLLLEAGNAGAAVPFSHVPGLVAFLQRSALDWGFASRPQETSHGAMKGRKSVCPRGKVLGGTSAINYMLHVRGRRSDYERWGQGLQGWGWADVEPFYKKMETFPEGGSDRGKVGPIRASLVPDSAAFRALWLGAVAELGGPTTPDYNGAEQRGWGRVQMSARDGKRSSTASTYLEGAKGRPNLHVAVDSTAARVLFDGKRAVGVEFEWATDGRLHQARTKKEGEVILSAGAIASPQLLLLSGIGDIKQLGEFGIPIVADSPAVGENLMDHMFTLMYFKVNQTLGADWYPMGTWGHMVGFAGAVWDYVVHGTGSLTHVGLHLQAFADSGLAGARTASPDLHLYAVNRHQYGDIGERNVGFRPEVQAAETGRLDGGHFVLSIASGLQQPLSVGRVRLASADFREPPDIDPRYLSRERDVHVMVHGLKELLKIVHSRSLAHLDPQTAETAVPGCEGLEFASDPYLECLVRQKAKSLYHPTSTCRMGNDPNTSVVDSQLRVHGVKNLRVADASVFPDIVSGNTNLPSILIGEKLAAILLGK